MDKSEVYNSKKTFVKYDKNHYLLYINEEIIPDYVDEQHSMDGTQEEPYTGFKYTGNFPDGGTLIECTEATHDAFVNGLVRTRYTAEEEQKYLRSTRSRKAPSAEQQAFMEFRQHCIDEVNKLPLEM